jgi:hypothetical protein
MPRVLTAVVAAIGLVLLTGPATAWGSGTIVEPGDPGSSQYQDDIPPAAGSRPVLTVHTVTHQQPAALVALPHAVARQLAHDGRSGRGAATLAQATAPLPTTRRPSRMLTSGHVKSTVAVLAASLFGSDGGVSVLLPILLLISLGVAIVLSLRRRKE